MKSTRACTVLAAAITLGCGGGGSKAKAPVGPSGEVKLEITGFFNDDGESFPLSAADALVLGCDGTINVEVGPIEDGTLKNWLLRPPDTCGTLVQCGYIELVADPSSDSPAKIAGATTSLSVEGIDPGPHALEVTLYTDDGEPFLQEEQPVKDRVEVKLEAAKGCEGTSGSGGSGGSGGGEATSMGGTNQMAGGGAAGEGGAAGAH